MFHLQKTLLEGKRDERLLLAFSQLSIRISSAGFPPNSMFRVFFPTLFGKVGLGGGCGFVHVRYTCMFLFFRVYV